MPMPGQRNSLTAKATAVFLYHLFTSLAPPSKALPFQSLKFCYVGKYLGKTAPYFILFFLAMLLGMWDLSSSTWDDLLYV